MEIYIANGINSVQQPDGKQVPLDDEKYLAWLAEGNIPEQLDAPPQVTVDPVTKLAAFLAANPDVAALLQ